jgi:hypothetical protein
MKRLPLLAALLVLCAASAPAQTVYRCGPAGNDYRQTPCPGGQAVNVADPRTEGQRSEAGQRAQRDAQLAQDLRQEQAAQAGAASSQPAPPRKQLQPSADKKKPTARHHGKRHRDLPEDARMARAQAAKQAKTAKPSKAQP